MIIRLLVFCIAITFSSTAFAQSQPAADLSSFIRTPVAPNTPRINGPHIYGERPGRPFLYHLPVTGDRPLTFSAEGLPDGLVLDKTTGSITGSVAQAGTFAVKFTVKNALGQDTKTISFVIGPTVCLTPPMGWNSWNCFGPHIDETKIRAAADTMVKTDLIDHGWTYINMDDKWEGQRSADGKIQPGPEFSDMKSLADYIHGLGLKVGLYSSPGPLTCGNGVASYQHEDQDAQTYGEWTMDYLKYDWCSYQNIFITRRAEKFAAALPDSAAEITQLAALLKDTQAKNYGFPPYAQRTTDPEEKKQLYALATDTIAKLDAIYNKVDAATKNKIDVEVYKEPYLLMRKSLDKVNRDIVFSYCQYGYGNVWEWGADAGGNTWRTTQDISPNWKRMTEIGFAQNELAPYAGPGHWNDPDMLEVGNGSLTPDENYTHMTLWCMLSAPLLIGCDMTKMSPFTTSLFSNDEVLAVDQDSLGKQGQLVKRNGTVEVWSKPLDDGSLAVAFFNRGETAADVAIAWSDLGLQGSQPVRDLWRQKDVGAVGIQYSVNVAPHGAELFKIGHGK